MWTSQQEKMLVQIRHDKMMNFYKLQLQTTNSAGSRGSGSEASISSKRKHLINSMGQWPVQRAHASWILLTTRKEKQLQIENQENLDENSNSDQTYQKNRSKDKKRTKKASDIVETLAK